MQIKKWFVACDTICNILFCFCPFPHNIMGKKTTGSAILLEHTLAVVKEHHMNRLINWILMQKHCRQNKVPKIEKCRVGGMKRTREEGTYIVVWWAHEQAKMDMVMVLPATWQVDMAKNIRNLMLLATQGPPRGAKKIKLNAASCRSWGSRIQLTKLLMPSGRLYSVHRLCNMTLDKKEKDDNAFN